MKKQMTPLPAPTAHILKQRENYLNVFLTTIQHPIHLVPIPVVPVVVAAAHPVISETRLA